MNYQRLEIEYLQYRRLDLVPYCRENLPIWRAEVARYERNARRCGHYPYREARIVRLDGKIAWAEQVLARSHQLTLNFLLAAGAQSRKAA